MPRSILIPLDDSSQSTAALKHALSTYSTEDITVLHVISTAEGVAYGGGMAIITHEKAAEEHASELFAEAQQLADEHGVNLSTVTAQGVPSRAIIEYARTNEIDHIIMGSHGRTGVKRYIFGSVAETVVRRAPVPVTIVR